MTNLHVRLISELTAMDRKQMKRKGYNPYALAQYFKAAEGVTDAKSFAAAFTPTRAMHGVAKRLGFALDVEHGEWKLTGEER